MLKFSLLLSGNGMIIWSINLAIKALIVLAATSVVLWLLRRSSAASRHQIITISAMIIFLLPLLSFLVPSWNLELIPGFQQIEASAASGFISGQMPEVQGVNEVQGWSLSTWLLIIWILGTVLMLLRLFAGRLLGIRTIMNTRQETDDRLNQLLEDTSEHVGINKNIMLLRSPAVKVPVIYGAVFPRLILPTKANEWPDERLEAIFIHELSHIKRYDILTQTLAQFVCCLHWFNPLAWVVERRMMIERERACDDVVLIKGKRASEYARHLMESAGALGPRKNPAWAMVAMAEGTDFKDRVLSILDPNARRSAPRIAFSTIAGLIAALFLVPFVAAQPFAIEPIQITRDLEARSETVTKPSVDEKTEKSEVADKEYSSDEEISATFNKRLFHGIADLVESDNPEEDGKEFGARMINMIADFIPEDNEDDVMAKKFMKGVGDLIKYADNPEMARKKAADLIRALGDLPEHQKREMMDLVEKEIEKASNWPE